MSHERLLIAEGRLSSLLILACVPVILMLVITVPLLNGGSGDSTYYRAFGPVVYVFLYGGLLYSTYEFWDTLLRRREYVSVVEGTLYILHHRPIEISEISDVYLVNGLFSRNVAIDWGSRETTRIKGHLLKERPDIVAKKLRALAT
jgi:hypothetical protein